jgi:hypothetical protein
MLFLKSGNDLYWDGDKFQSDHRKGIVFAAMMGAGNDLRKAKKIDPNCVITSLSDSQWAEFIRLRGAA